MFSMDLFFLFELLISVIATVSIAESFVTKMTDGQRPMADDRWTIVTDAGHAGATAIEYLANHPKNAFQDSGSWLYWKSQPDMPQTIYMYFPINWHRITKIGFLPVRSENAPDSFSIVGSEERNCAGRKNGQPVDKAWIPLLHVKSSGIPPDHDLSVGFQSWVVPYESRRPFRCIGLRIHNVTKTDAGRSSSVALRNLTMWEESGLGAFDCGERGYKCGNDLCIYREKLCDGRPDCHDARDEGFICRLNRDCYLNGRGYRGLRNTTQSGRTCQAWNSHTPHSHPDVFTPESHPSSGLVENFCRNPDNKPEGPWCYTTDENRRLEYCGVPNCYGIVNCAQNPCKHGTCQDVLNGFNCTCEMEKTSGGYGKEIPRWRGKRCDQKWGLFKCSFKKSLCEDSVSYGCHEGYCWSECRGYLTVNWAWWFLVPLTQQTPPTEWCYSSGIESKYQVCQTDDDCTVMRTYMRKCGGACTALDTRL